MCFTLVDFAVCRPMRKVCESCDLPEANFNLVGSAHDSGAAPIDHIPLRLG